MKADLLAVLINFPSILDPAITLAVATSTLIGVWMVGQALMNAYILSLDNSSAWGSNATINGVIWSLIIGGILVMPVFYIQIFGNTLLAVPVTSQGMLYQATGLSDTQRAAVKALFGLFTLAGFVAFLRGWITLNKYANNVIREGLGTGITFVVFGTLLVYLDVVLDAISDLTGIDFVSILLF